MVNMRYYTEIPNIRSRDLRETIFPNKSSQLKVGMGNFAAGLHAGASLAVDTEATATRVAEFILLGIVEAKAMVLVVVMEWGVYR